jgi:ribosomal protein L11 methyltransferase
MWMWTKLARTKSLAAWEERIGDDPDFVVEILTGGHSVRVNRYSENREEAEEFRTRFGGTVRELRREDWARSPAVPPPVKIRDRLLLTAETEPDGIARLEAEYPDRAVLSIPSEMAFGTGTHATTGTCLRLLADIARERKWMGGGDGQAGDSVADLGAGSGVLAVAARSMGAGTVWACDFDPLAVKVARRNAERNRVTGVEVAECDVLRWEPPKRFDVVLANLFSTILIEAMPVLARALAPGGDLVISGILREQALGVFAAAAAHGLGFRQVVRRGKWVSARGGSLEGD